MTYISIAIYAVPSANQDKFVEHSKVMTPVFKKHGALTTVDCWGDDIQDGEVTSLPMAVKLEEGETVAYSHIIWPDKAAHDAGMQKAMEEMQSLEAANPMPFDGKRMIFGNFATLLKV